ncbi:hypothetical protein MWU59_02820 [Flavobacteriaceae bacterium F08102]|nr:hypothetical protein [Flavobacteriaceae bacterium F08102]
MKKIAIIALLFITSMSFAQTISPVFEVKGDLVKVTYYHDNGKIEQEGYFKDNKLQGTWNYYNQEGEKIAMGNYDSGRKVGKWFFWSNGTLKEVTFTDQKIASIDEWKEKTVVVSNE